MSFTIEKKQDSIIVVLKENSFDLSLISQVLDENYCHIIFDLLNLSSVNEADFKNFTTFGNINTKNGSFVMVFKGSYNDDYAVVPTLDEAFDFIEMENIERLLK
jgi:hypothetical protein